MSQADVIIHFAAQSRDGAAPHKCGEMEGFGTTTKRNVTCTGCLAQLGRGNSRSPLHTPPVMNDDDGIFEFYDIHLDAGGDYSLEVVPQLSGNVEITMGDSLFTLSHLDRMDLIRALLHDFHYSPERGGPNDIDS